MHSFKNSLVLVEQGLVGSNFVKEILLEHPRKIIVIDNLLSSNTANVSMDERVELSLAP